MFRTAILLAFGRSLVFTSAEGTGSVSEFRHSLRRSVINPVRRVLLSLGSLPPAKQVLLGYATYISIGWAMLCLPAAQKGAGASSLDNLFTATSAVSTTGLTTISVADCYSLFGQIIVLVLIQLGGIGYMTIGSFVVLSRHAELPMMRGDVGRVVFSLPASFRIDKFIRSVIKFTLLIEVVGACCLYPLFVRAGLPDPAYSAIFHSVSAFCTAGFSLYNNSFESFVDNFWINAVVAALSYLGAIGFIVCVDFWRMFQRKVDQITMTSKIILWMTVGLTIAGTLLLFLAESGIQDKPAHLRLIAAFFQCMTAMTTVGFNTIGMAALSKASILLIIVLMVIGASPAGTGGGIKSTTVSAMLGVMWSAVRGRREVCFWGRAIPTERIRIAIASLGFYLVALLTGAYILDLVEDAPFDKCFFEAASALGTVGLSMGITAELSIMGKLVLVAMMYAGRMGPLTLAVALFNSPKGRAATLDNDLAV